jgi:hypothetical protein
MYVDIEGLTPNLFGNLKEPTRSRLPGGMDKNVDTSPKGIRFGNDAGTIFRIAYVGLDVYDFCAMRRRSRFKRFEGIVSRASPHNRNVGSACDKRQSRHLANATCSPGDQTYLTRQFHPLVIL